MQEDVEHRTVALAVSAVKFTGRVLKEAISRHSQNMKAQKREKKAQKAENKATKPGRVTLRQLQKQHGELCRIDVDDRLTRDFDRIARKYHVQYNVFRCETGKYQIFFKAPNSAAMEAAFRDYAARKIVRSDRTPIRETLQKLREKAAAIPAKIAHRQITR